MGVIGKIHLRRKSVTCTNCEDTMLWNYMKVIEKKDYKFLHLSGPLPKKNLLQKRYEEINEEFSGLRGENNMIKKFDLISYREELILKVHFGVVLLDTLQTQVAFQIIAPKTLESLLAELESWEYYINRDIPLIDALEECKSEIEALQMTIAELSEELHPTEENDEVEITNSVFNFYSMLLIYARLLKKENIDPKKTSLLEFAVMEKAINELKDSNNRNQSKSQE